MPEIIIRRGGKKKPEKESMKLWQKILIGVGVAAIIVFIALLRFACRVAG